MHKVQLIIKLLLQLGIIIVITYIGTRNSKDFSSSLSRQYCWSIFILLLQFKIVPLTSVEDGANFLLKTMVFFHTVSCRYYGCCLEITLNYILFFAVIIIGTCIVALSSGYIAEKMSVKHKHRKGVDAYEYYVQALLMILLTVVLYYFTKRLQQKYEPIFESSINCIFRNYFCLTYLWN